MRGKTADRTRHKIAINYLPGDSGKYLPQCPNCLTGSEQTVLMDAIPYMATTIPVYGCKSCSRIFSGTSDAQADMRRYVEETVHIALPAKVEEKWMAMLATLERKIALLEKSTRTDLDRLRERVGDWEMAGGEGSEPSTHEAEEAEESGVPWESDLEGDQ